MHTAFNPMGVTDMAKDYIIDYGSNSNGWWRKWKSGFIEQGSLTEVAFGTSHTPTGTVTLPISFSNTKYIILYTLSSSSYSSVIYYPSKKVNSFNWGKDASNSQSAGGRFNWFVCGY